MKGCKHGLFKDLCPVCEDLEKTPIKYKVKAELKICPYCKRDKPCIGTYPEGCFHPDGK